MNLIDIPTEIKIHGYENSGGIITPTQDLIDFTSFITDLNIEERKFILGLSSKKEVINNTKDFFNRHFKLQKVPFKGRIRNKLDTPILKYTPGLKVPLYIHNNFMRYINPLKLPVSFSSSEITDCMLIENATFIRTEEFINNMKLSYSGIILPREITELSESSYVHEITHAEVAHLKGIIRDYHNRETLSIFMEILNIYESENQDRLLPLQDAVRLVELKGQIKMLDEHTRQVKEYDEEDLLIGSVYTASILRAYHLFAEYYYGTPALRKYILNSIQNIFNGNLQLEELIEEFEPDINELSKNQTLKKYFSR